MKPFTIVLIVIVVVLLVAGTILYFLGKKMEKKQAAQKSMMDSVAQTITMLVIDKKKMKLKDSGLPKVVYEQTPKYLRMSKVPVVKAKVGPRIMSLMCDVSVFDKIPVKQEVKATVSGIYITDVRGMRGAVLQTPKKRSLFAKAKDKLDSMTASDPAKKKSGQKSTVKVKNKIKK